MVFLFVNNEIWTITVLGWLIVFAALIFLVVFFLLIPKIIKWATIRAEVRRGRHNAATSQEEDVLTGEMNAAISMALYLYFNEVHEEESNIITIKEVKRRYSPWSSKLYGMNNMNFPR